MDPRTPKMDLPAAKVDVRVKMMSLAANMGSRAVNGEDEMFGLP